MIRILLFVAIVSSCKGQTSSISDSDRKTGTIVTEISNEIWGVHHDLDGNYWFGSNGFGLYKYDGDTITHYTERDGLVDNTIRGFREDQKGNLFISTPTGISKFDGHIFTTLQPVKATLADWKLESDDLWFNHNAGKNGPYRYDGEHLYDLPLPKQDVESIGVNADNPVYDIYGVYAADKDAEGIMWFGTSSIGAFRYDGEGFTWIHEQELLALADGREPAIRSVIQDKDGYHWFSNSLYKYRFYKNDDGSISFDKLPGIESKDDQVNIDFPYFMSAVVDDMDQDLWLQTYSEGVFRYDGADLRDYHIGDSYKNELIFGMMKDRKGDIWLSTQHDGVYRYDPDKDSFLKFQLNK